MTVENECALVNQGFKPGKCLVYGKKEKGNACRITLKYEQGIPRRLITSIILSRPEHYLSIYQSGCNLDCLKCHSWSFSQHAEGQWLSPQEILSRAEEYAAVVTYYEPLERATSFHALDLCRGCGTCIELRTVDIFDEGVKKGRMRTRSTGKRGPLCPNKLEPRQVILSPQGFGPARNIAAFTGGDIGCRPDFYAQCAEKIKKKNLRLWVLFETNGYGLTPQNLDMLKSSGIDSFWLDIKAFDPQVHKKLTGVANDWIVKLPGEMKKRGFVLEVLTLFIPGWVEEDQVGKIAEIVSAVDHNIPFTILAFFPEYKMKDTAKPSLDQMIRAYEKTKEAGLQNVRLGNLGVFIRSNTDLETLIARTDNAI